MVREEILKIIEDEARLFNWSLNEALYNLSRIGFTVDKVEGNALFDENKVRQSVHWANHALI